MVITMIDTKYKIKSKKNDIFPFINGIIMVLFVIVTLYPVLNTLAISLNDGTDALRGGIYPGRENSPGKTIRRFYIKII